MYDVSVIMGIADFVPVFLFGWSAVMLQRDLYDKMPKYAFACFAAGTINVFLAGFFKAAWKLLYAAGLCDFHVLNTMFLPVESIGLLLTGLGVILMLTGRKRNMALAVAAPPVFTGTFVFITMMVLGLGGMRAGLSVVAAKMKKRAVIALLVLTFFCYMGMGYLASRDSASAGVNWAEQGVNTLGMLFLLWGVLTLHKAGLKEFDL